MCDMNKYERNKEYILKNSSNIDFNRFDENIKKTELIETEEGKSLVIKNGSITKYVYSKYTPIETAKLQVEHLHGDQENVIIVFGSGLFYEIIEVAKNWTLPSKILVVEPDEQTFLECIKYLDFEIETKNIEYKFYVNNDELDYKRFLHTNIVEGDALKTKVYVSIAYRELYYREYAHFMRSTADKTREKEININTSREFFKLKLDNLQKNIINYPKAYNGSTFNNKFDGATAIVVAAGPSLNKNVELLKAVQGKVLIIAVYTAMPTLKKHGIVPDFVASIDPRQPLHQDDIENGLNYNFLVDVTSHSEITKNNKGKNYYMMVAASNIFVSMFETKKQKFAIYASGGSVATFAFSAAIEFGAETVALIGQDLAFLDGKTHSFDNPLGEIENIRDKLTTKGYYGGTVDTNVSWNSFRTWFEDNVELFRDAGITTRMINATEGGVYIKNFEHIPLKEVLDQAKYVDIQKIIDEVDKDAKISMEDTKEVYAKLKKTKEVLESIKDQSEEGFEAIEKIEKLYKHNDRPKASQVNKQIAVLQKFDQKVKKNIKYLHFVSEVLEVEMELMDIPLKVGENKDLKTVRDNKSFYEGINKSIDAGIIVLDKAIEGLEEEYGAENLA